MHIPKLCYVWILENKEENVTKQAKRCTNRYEKL